MVKFNKKYNKYLPIVLAILVLAIIGLSLQSVIPVGAVEGSQFISVPDNLAVGEPIFLKFDTGFNLENKDGRDFGGVWYYSQENGVYTPSIKATVSGFDVVPVRLNTNGGSCINIIDPSYNPSDSSAPRGDYCSFRTTQNTGLLSADGRPDPSLFVKYDNQYLEYEIPQELPEGVYTILFQWKGANGYAINTFADYNTFACSPSPSCAMTNYYAEKTITIGNPTGTQTCSLECPATQTLDEENCVCIDNPILPTDDLCPLPIIIILILLAIIVIVAVYKKQIKKSLNK